MGEGGDDGDGDGVAELAVGLGVGDGDLVGIRVAHEACAFARGEAARVAGGALGDEDFAAVFVIASGERAGDPVGAEDTAAEAIALGFVFGGVVLEVGPELVGERVFCGRGGVENGGEGRVVVGRAGELIGMGLAEADEEDAFAVLGEPVAGVDDAGVDVIAEVFGERAVDDGEGAALVVAGEVFDVFEDEGGGLVVLDDACDFEEEIALADVIEAVGSAEGVFLADPSETEGLAGEAAAEDVVRGDVGGGDEVDVAGWFLAEVGGVGDTGPAVPVGGEDAVAAELFEGETEAADAAEQVDEARAGHFSDLSGTGWCGGSISSWKKAVMSGLTEVSTICQRPSER